jgi:uncharacterized protein YkwD
MVTTATYTSRRALACLLAACAALLVMAPGATAASARLDRVERSVLQRFNFVRAHAGLRPLRRSRALARAANAHNLDMLAANFFAHSSSNGLSMADRLHRFRPSSVLGEILACVPGRPRGQAGTVVGLWLASPGHRAALLTPGFRRVGIARGTGSLHGAQVTVFTADFSSAR